MKAERFGLARGRKWWALGGFVVLVGLSGLSVWLLAHGGQGERTVVRIAATSEATTSATVFTRPSPTPTADPHHGLLDGVVMSDAEWEARKGKRPLAVMIDNTAGGVPQAGLDRADLVYEAFVEGGITRFMAVFWRREADLVLPVRSARTPFVIWASELDALFAHAGAAQTGNEADAGAQIAEWKVRDLDAFAPELSNAFHRIADRFAPYNLATSTEALRKAAAETGMEGVSFTSSWTFADDRSRGSGGVAAGGIEISFRNQRFPNDLIQWKWEPLANEYVRYQWGGTHTNLPGLQPLRFKNVVVMRVPLNVVDSSGHVVLQQFGEGLAQIFVDGLVVEGKWRKADRAARTRFFDGAGREIAFNRGPILIEVLGPGSLIVLTPTASGLPPLPEYQPPTFGVPDPEDGGPSPTPGPSGTVAPSPTVGRTATATTTATASPTLPAATPTQRPTATATATPDVPLPE